MILRHLFFLIPLLAMSPWPVEKGHAAERPINPYPREVVNNRLIAEWDFSKATTTQGWVAHQQCTIEAADGWLTIHSTGGDPNVLLPPLDTTGPLELTFRIRSTAPGPAVFFWSTDKAGFHAERRMPFHFPRDGEWHESRVVIDTAGTIARLRFDPSVASGESEIAWLKVRQRVLHPLEIESVEVKGPTVVTRVVNHGAAPIEVRSGHTQRTIPPGEAIELEKTAPGKKPFEPVDVRVAARGLPPLLRRVWVSNPGVAFPDLRHRLSGDSQLSIVFAPDGSGAWIRLREEGSPPGVTINWMVAVLAPLVASPDGVGLGPLQLVESDGQRAVFRGGPVRSLELEITENELHYRLDASKPCEGPVVRVLGIDGLEQGILAGVEYLGRGERSSTTLDIRTPEHVRFAPNPMDVTMPLMAFINANASVAVTWSDSGLQPVFATPNFFDGTKEHRIALRGKTIDATVRVDRGWRAGESLEDAILWSVRKRGLPPVPEPPRTWEEQKRLCMAGFDGPLQNDDGWGHCAQDHWPRKPFADCASTIFRLTGNLPELPKIVPGGGHIRNSAAYFLSGRADEWLQHLIGQAAGARRRQRPDGSYRYQDKFAEGHFEDTASGYCGLQATILLNHAWYTGSAESLSAGEKALAFTRRFRTPRGAQTWEVPLHTPDILASAHLTKANVLAFQLTDNPAYLAEARRWAITGLPFVYQWSNRPVMRYATIAVLGATNWKAPNWIGLPVQWCGLVYTEAVLMLAEHDNTLDWRKLADGITTSGEWQQYTDGPSIGCLPDSFELKSQTGRPWDINPCALVSLRMRLRGEQDGLAVAAAGPWRVVSPFPVEIDGDVATVDGRKGVPYQVVVFRNDSDEAPRIVDVVSRGQDEVALGIE